MALRGQRRLAPLAKRSTCSKSIKVSAPANFRHFILASKSFCSKFRWCNMHIWFSFSNIPSHFNKRKSTQKLTDLPEVKEQFSFPLLRKKTAGDTRSAIWLPFSASIQQNLFTAWIHWQTTAAVSPIWFFLLLFKLWWPILLASSQDTLRSWNILRFPGLIIV